MKFSTILIIGLIILIGLTSYSEASVLENEQYIICGHVYEPYTYNAATLENIRTMEIQSVEIIDCGHGLKEYLFNLANFRQGWLHVDAFIIRYGNQSITVQPDMNDIGIQADFNRPLDIDPIAIITGTILVLTSGGYYYIKRKGDKNMSENVEVKETNVIEKKDTPLGLPVGSIRAILAIAGLIGMLGFEFYGKQMSGELVTVIIALVMTFVGAHVPIIKNK